VSAGGEVGVAGVPDAADLERRFGGLRRLYGDAAYARLRAGRVAIIGVGGVGSWAAEALARSGIAALTLIDLDHVAESNVNRQVQALGSTLGAAKVGALAQRIAEIHPGCAVHQVEQFVEAGNWPALLHGGHVDVVIDACDQASAKLVLAAWAMEESVPSGASLVVCGAAGGKRQPQAVAVDDLAQVTHDPLLASLRQRLRKQFANRQLAGPRARFGLHCVYSREAVVRPVGDDATDGTLSCHGYGSGVTVTATFGMVAAQQAIELLIALRQ
jgi:tRNA A37 threonylcarbamoyladenosine dehydratase